MKRVIVILTCFSVFYAGVLWALKGCSDLGVGFDTQHHAEDGVLSQHHDAGAAPQHSHSDPTKVHCPNPLAQFVLTSRVSLEREGGWTLYTAGTETQVRCLSNSLNYHDYALGPPGPGFSNGPHRFLLLSVIRI